MAKQPSNLSSLGANPSIDRAGGIKPSDLIDLPDSQQKIAQWLMTQSDCTLAEVAAHTDLDEGEALLDLDKLMQRGFVQELEVNGELIYRIRLASREGLKQFSETIQQALAPGSPLAVIPNPSGEHAVVAGSSFELRVTVSNKGYQSALIDVYIDEVSQTLLQWCTSSNERLALSPQSTSEVVFPFEVPAQALPGIYNYMLVVDAPQHYPEDTPIRYSQRLQVLPYVEDAVRVSDPTFIVLPTTSSSAPAVIQPGQVLQVSVLVNNRSDRVDRFWLTVPDLEETWFTVRYPESLEQVGLVVAGDGLDLNPGAKGEITLLLNPPLQARAGSYFPTLRVQSANNPDLMLLDIVYLQVLPTYLLSVELRTLIGKVRRMAGLFEVRLTNQGNTVREVIIRAITLEEEELCSYTLEPTQVQILPGSTANAALEVKPNKWWRRPFYGGGLLINFGVELEDVQQLPLPQDMPRGTLVWEPRPWWQFLLLILTGLGTLAAIAFLIWWLFFKPPAAPKIIEFTSDNPSYKEVDGDFIRLNWQIRNPQQIQSLSVTGLSANGTASVQPRTYDFSKGIPNDLKQFCLIRTVLICKNVRTEARQAGDYSFELKVFPKKGKDVAADSVKTNTIKIQPLDLPKIVDFVSTKPVYQEASDLKIIEGGKIQPQKPNGVGTIILLNWKIINSNQMKELKLIGRAPDGSVNSGLMRFDFSKGVPKELNKFCQFQEELICQNVPIGVGQAGNYIFEMTVVPQKGQPEPPISAKTDTIKIQPILIPLKIISLKVNGQDAASKYLVPTNPQRPIRTLVLSWQVQGGKGTKVELLPAPGTIPPVGAISYPLSQQPSRETITLKVTNAAGEEISRSVTFETINLVPAPSSSPSASPSGSPSSSPSASPSASPSGSPSSSPSGSPSATLPVLPVLPQGLPTLLPLPQLSPSASPAPSPSSNADKGSPAPSPSASASPSPSASASPSPSASPAPSPSASASPSPGASPSPSSDTSPSPSVSDPLSPSELPPRFD